MSEDTADATAPTAGEGSASGEHASAETDVRVTDSDATDASAETGASQPRRPQYAPPKQEEFDWRGWVLVGIIVVSFLVIPGAILYLPYAQSFIASLGIGFRTAYLTLPMIPAILLGATAVWAALRTRME